MIRSVVGPELKMNNRSGHFLPPDESVGIKMQVEKMSNILVEHISLYGFCVVDNFLTDAVISQLLQDIQFDIACCG